VQKTTSDPAFRTTIEEGTSDRFASIQEEQSGKICIEARKTICDDRSGNGKEVKAKGRSKGGR
jgi:hypothetical protein